MISLAVSNEHSTIFLMWAHIGDHVSEYIVYVDGIERTTVSDVDGFCLENIHVNFIDFGEKF